MNYLARITKNDDGDIISPEEQKWCLVDPRPIFCDTNRTLCTQEALDESTDCEWEVKVVARGGITCEHCLAILKTYKAVRL